MRHLSVLILLQFILTVSAQDIYAYAPDQVPVTGDTLKNIASDTVKTPGDSLKRVNIEQLKAESDMESSIAYKSAEVMILDMDNKTLYLEKDAELTYQDMKLNADSILVDWESNTLHSGGKMDSTGQISGHPTFEENDQAYSAKRMSYNFKTRKGIVHDARTNQGEEYLIANVVRKEDDQTYYIKNGKFTSCDLETPHYYIRSSKLKVIPRNKIISGPLMLVVEDFPLPLVLPFGFFPNQEGRRSGLVMPTYGESDNRGFFLRDGGYYFSLSDKADLMVRGDIFTKGSWRLEASTDYNDRYHVNGTFVGEYGVQKFGEKTDASYSETKNFMVRWKHSQKITPQASLTGDVQVGSTTYLKNFSYSDKDYLTNTLRSSINFNQRFANSPWSFNLALAHSQNNSTKQVDLTLPSMSLQRPRIYPFKGKNATGKKWYYDIGLSYTANLQNKVSMPDSLVGDILFRPYDPVELITITEDDTTSDFKRPLDYYKNGLLQSIPIATQLTALNYINIKPSFTYNEYWFIKTIEKTFVDSTNSVESEDIYGFKTARDFNFSVNSSTRLYGVFQTRSKNQAAFRHTFMPSVSYTYKPDFSDPFWGFYKTVQSDTSGETQTYSIFQGNAFSGPGAGESQTLGLTLGNILEMKYRAKDADTDSTRKDPYNRLNLLDMFQVSTNYNFAKDSLNLDYVRFDARTNVLNNKVSVRFNVAVDPYAVNSEGQRINTFRYQLNGSIGRLSQMGLSLTTGLQSKRNKSKEPRKEDFNEDEWNHVMYYRDLYVDFNVPWKINTTFNMSYTNTGIRRDTTLTLNFSGDFNITPKWKIGGTSGWDFTNNDFSYTSINIYRDLHCWEMTLQWVPFGDRKRYQLGINVKSATLRDLKLSKRRDWQDRF